MGGVVFLSCWLFGIGCPALELAGCWVELGLSVEMDISGKAFAIWYYVEPGGLLWTNVLNSALPPQSHRPDTWPEHQDPVSHMAPQGSWERQALISSGGNSETGSIKPCGLDTVQTETTMHLGAAPCSLICERTASPLAHQTTQDKMVTTGFFISVSQARNPGSSLSTSAVDVPSKYYLELVHSSSSSLPPP